MQLRRITQPERVDYFAPPPLGWHEAKRCTTVFPASGSRAEARILPDGRLAVEYSDRYTLSGQPWYYVFASEQAYRDWAHREPHRDPEGRGGRWYPSDYTRLGVLEKHITDETQYRGYRRENVCTCRQCGTEVNYHKAHYLVGGNNTPQYFSFCSNECAGQALDQKGEK